MTKAETVNELLVKAKKLNLLNDYIVEFLDGDYIYTIRSGNRYYTYLINLLRYAK